MGELFLTHPEHRAALQAAGLGRAADLLALGDPAQPRRFVGFVSLPGADQPGHHLKRYRYAGWRDARGLLGRGTLWGVPPEVREFRALLALQEAGVPAVTPVAACATWRGRRLTAHALLTARVPDVQDLHTRLRRAGDPVAQEGPPRLALLALLGRSLARMHAAGFAHRDCHARNVLVRLDDGVPAIWWLDCRRGGGRLRRGRDEARDLAALDHDLRDHLGAQERRALLQAYLGGAADGPAVEALARRVAAAARRLPPPRP